MVKFKKIAPTSYSEEMGVPAKRMDKIKHYPTFHVALKHLPEAKKWKVGNTYRIALEVQQSDLHVRNEKEGRGSGDVGFDIVGIAVLGEGKESPAAKPEPKKKAYRRV